MCAPGSEHAKEHWYNNENKTRQDKGKNNKGVYEQDKKVKLSP
jgi:hypothetical protein